LKTTVIQSYRTKNVPGWIQLCLKSGQAWAAACGYDYRFVDDKIFDKVPKWYVENTGHQIPTITDLGRLILIREEFSSGADRAIWLDADVIIFDPTKLIICDDFKYAFGREYWVQKNKNGRGLKVYRNVHNAICLFQKSNPFLEFYIHACKQIISRSSGNVPNQIIGTKFLTALHNIMKFDLIDSVGMASPLVLRDIAAGGGLALNRLYRITNGPLAALNLCSSLVDTQVDGVDMSEDLMQIVCEHLIKRGLLLD